MDTDTIYALASARGKAGIAVLRISGPSAFGAARRLIGDLPEPRRAGLRKIRSSGGEVLDQALVLAFSEGHSFTGEDTVEFNLHGSVAVVNAVQSALSKIPGLRPAEPGEFTRRALENERLDLTQVEGLADLIDAETELQRLQAQRVLSGAIGRKVGAWRQDLIRAAALLEATIDFADEDIPMDVTPEVSILIDRTLEDLRAEVDGSRVAERIRDGFEIAIVGAPNVGKSTLLNALAGRDAAITSELAGTTRDVIEVRMDLEGIPVTFLDTAGLRTASDKVEAEGVERARRRASQADIRVGLFESAPEELGVVFGEDDIILVCKDDRGLSGSDGISGRTGFGIGSLVKRIVRVLEKRASGVQTATRGRHRDAMGRALGFLVVARREIESGPDRVEFAAVEIRSASNSLGELIGAVDVEDLLDQIFSSFCIGK